MNLARSLFWCAASAALLELSSGRAHACAACFGKSDSNMAKGMNMGIFALLLVITCVLAGVASFFVFLGRRESQFLPADQLRDPLSENPTNA
jgi:hypothetical protein